MACMEGDSENSDELVPLQAGLPHPFPGLLKWHRTPVLTQVLAQLLAGIQS